MFGGRLSRREVRAHRRRLDSYDPDERKAAGAVLVRRGLTRSAATALLQYLKREEDQRVRFGLALAVARTNGGRSRRRRVRLVRRWAADELVEHGHPVHQGLEQQRGRKRPVLSWRVRTPQS